MRMNNICFLVVFSVLLSSCKETPYNKNRLTNILLADSIYIGVPENWNIIDSSFIVSDGLVGSMTYYSSDSMEFCSFDNLDYRSAKSSVTFNELFERKKASMSFFVERKNILVNQKTITRKAYQVKTIKGSYFNTKTKKYVCLCDILIEILERKYLAVSLQVMEKTLNAAENKVNIIIGTLFPRSS